MKEIKEESIAHKRLNDDLLRAIRAEESLSGLMSLYEVVDHTTQDFLARCEIVQRMFAPLYRMESAKAYFEAARYAKRCGLGATERNLLLYGFETLSDKGHYAFEEPELLEYLLKEVKGGERIRKVLETTIERAIIALKLHGDQLVQWYEGEGWFRKVAELIEYFYYEWAEAGYYCVKTLQLLTVPSVDADDRAEVEHVLVSHIGELGRNGVYKSLAVFKRVQAMVLQGNYVEEPAKLVARLDERTSFLSGERA